MTMYLEVIKTNGEQTKVMLNEKNYSALYRSKLVTFHGKVVPKDGLRSLFKKVEILKFLELEDYKTENIFIKISDEDLQVLHTCKMFYYVGRGKTAVLIGTKLTMEVFLDKDAIKALVLIRRMREQELRDERLQTSKSKL